MKVIYLSDSKIPSRSANSVHVMKMCAALCEVGIDTTLISKKGGSPKVDLFFDYAVTKKFTIKQFSSGSGKIGSIWYNLQCLIHIQQYPRDTEIYGRSIIGVYLSLLIGFQSVNLELHQPPMNKLRRYVLSKIFKHKNFKNLIVITHTLRDYYCNTFDSLKGNVYVLPDGADSIVLHNNYKNPFPASNGLVVTYTGQLYSGKAMEILLPLAARCPKVQFKIIGGDDIDVQHWKKQVSVPNINFYGFMPQSDLSPYRVHSDVLIAPYSEQVTPLGGKEDIASWMSPLKIFEYMATGKAIICSNLPVLREVLEHNKTAILCNPNNIDEWVKAIESLEDEGLRTKLGTNAQTKFLQQYTWHKRAESLKNILRK